MKPPVTITADMLPLEILGRCKRAAVKAGWLLETWCEFSDVARACLSPDASEEERQLFMRVVGERFEIQER